MIVVDILAAVLAAVFMCFIPFYWLPLICIVLGLMLEMNWRQTLRFAIFASFFTVAAAAYLDYMDANLISKRVGAVLQLPAAFVPLLPGFLMAWVAVFFSQLGSNIRTICKKSFEVRS